MPNAERKPGYYRVKYMEEWQIRFWDGSDWQDNSYRPQGIKDSYFQAIDETPIDPNPPAPDDNLINQLKSSEIF